MASPRQQIAAIDKQIDALRAITPRPADHFTKETELFRQRGFAQLERDNQEYSARQRAALKPLRFETCPTCGHEHAVAAE